MAILLSLLFALMATESLATRSFECFPDISVPTNDLEFKATCLENETLYYYHWNRESEITGVLMYCDCYYSNGTLHSKQEGYNELTSEPLLSSDVKRVKHGLPVSSDIYCLCTACVFVKDKFQQIPEPKRCRLQDDLMPSESHDSFNAAVTSSVQDIDITNVMLISTTTTTNNVHITSVTTEVDDIQFSTSTTTPISSTSTTVTSISSTVTRTKSTAIAMTTGPPMVTETPNQQRTDSNSNSSDLILSLTVAMVLLLGAVSVTAFLLSCISLRRRLKPRKSGVVFHGSSSTLGDFPEGMPNFSVSIYNGNDYSGSVVTILQSLEPISGHEMKHSEHSNDNNLPKCDHDNATTITNAEKKLAFQSLKTDFETEITTYKEIPEANECTGLNQCESESVIDNKQLDAYPEVDQGSKEEEVYITSATSTSTAGGYVRDSSLMVAMDTKVPHSAGNYMTQEERSCDRTSPGSSCHYIPNDSIGYATDSNASYIMDSSRSTHATTGDSTGMLSYTDCADSRAVHVGEYIPSGAGTLDDYGDIGGTMVEIAGRRHRQISHILPLNFVSSSCDSSYLDSAANIDSACCLSSNCGSSCSHPTKSFSFDVESLDLGLEEDEPYSLSPPPGVDWSGCGPVSQQHHRSTTSTTTSYIVAPV